MKTCFIGMCGHSKQAYKTLILRKDVEICGVAPGSAHENLTESFSNEIPFFDSWEKMLEITQPDLAVISPVFGLTGCIVIECAKRGINVFCEKPVAASIDELDRVEAAVKNSGIRFSAMHYLRVAPAFWHGARLVREGAIGEVRLLNAQKSYRFGKRPEWYSDKRLFVGIIPWVGIHAIDWIYAFSGKKFLSVDARVYGNPEMVAVCDFSMEDGVMASASLDYYRPQAAPTHGDDRIRVVGTDGVLEVRDGKIHLLNSKGEALIEPADSPELLESFLNGDTLITAEEIFYLTRVALIARDAADNNLKMTVEV